MNPCLPFPGGCDHLLHMCSALAHDNFGNSSCLTYALDVNIGFERCKERSFVHGPDVVVDEAQSMPACLTQELPATSCTEVCDRLMTAAIPLGDACEESCTKMGACFSSCGYESSDPSPISACVGECMGPVVPIDYSLYSAQLNATACNTTKCEYLKDATEHMDNTMWHIKEALARADHMTAATRTLYDISRVGTTPPPAEPTPFPWPALQKRLGALHSDPFAAFSPATALPPVYELPTLPPTQ